METSNIEEQLKNKDFFISQDGVFYKVNDGDTLENFAEDYLKNNLNIKDLSEKNPIDYLVDFLGYVGYKHVGNNVMIIKPKYELYGMKMSNIQKKKLVDYVINIEQKSSALQTLTNVLEIDSDECSLILKKRR